MRLSFEECVQYIFDEEYIMLVQEMKENPVLTNSKKEFFEKKLQQNKVICLYIEKFCTLKMITIC